jgi:uncharacterized integral membrane protein
MTIDEEQQPEQPVAAPPAGETRRERARRHGKRARLYAWSALSIAALVVLIALVIANVRQVKIDWVFGSTHASLVWVVLASAVLGWLLGMATAVLFRFKTRSRKSDA